MLIDSIWIACDCQVLVIGQCEAQAITLWSKCGMEFALIIFTWNIKWNQLEVFSVGNQWVSLC